MNSSEKIEFVGLGFGSNDHLALVPEIPIDSKVRMLAHEIQGGGPAATSTVAAARLGYRAAFCGVIGDDDDGRRIIDDFKAEKVSVAGLKIRPGVASPIAYCWIDAPTGKRSVAWTRGDLKELAPEELDAEMIAGAKILHLDGHNPRAAVAAAKIVKAHGGLVNFDAGTMRDGTEELVALADLLITSEEFARKYTGEENLDRAIFKLAESGARVVGITMGALGSMVLDGSEILRCPTFNFIKPVDTTGAGDVYHTGFAIRYLETGDLMESMRFGSAVSSLKCLKLGGRAGIPTRTQVDDFLKKY